MSTRPLHPSTAPTANFHAPRWSIVLAAANDPAGTRSRRALEELARIYWFPLYAFIRRQGHDANQSQDLTQEFLTRLLEKNYLARVDQSKGQFRSFLLAAVKHFLANEWDKSHTLKRGGGGTRGGATIPLDALDAEARYAIEPADTLTPERLYERRWALALLIQVLTRLQQEYAAKGQDPLFETLKQTLTAGRDAAPHAQLARDLSLTPGAVKVATHRLRRRYRELLREETAQTVATPDLIAEEITYLLKCL